MNNRVYFLTIILVGAFLGMGFQMFIFPPMVAFFFAAISEETKEGSGIPTLAVGFVLAFGVEIFNLI